MRRFIDKLRQKPEPKRRQIALGVSAGVTGLVFAVWLTVTIHGGGILPTDSQSPAESQTQTASPLSALKSNAGSAIADLRQQFRQASATGTTATARNAASDFRQSTTSEPTTTPERNPSVGETRPVESEPYWKANDNQRSRMNPQTATSASEPNQPGEVDVVDNESFWKTKESQDQTQDVDRSNSQPSVTDPGEENKDFWQ